MGETGKSGCLRNLKKPFRHFGEWLFSFFAISVSAFFRTFAAVKTIYYPAETLPEGRYAATVGFFDGVHLGHRYVLERLRSLAAQRGLQTMVITFERHPRQVLHSDWQPQLLTTLDEKAFFVAKTGIDVLVVLRFSPTMAALSARQFMQQVLKTSLGVQLLLTGYDNRFGHDRTEGFEQYAQYGRELGIDVVCGEPQDVDSLRVSSSAVRRLLSEGRVAEAARCLGRSYHLSGRVVHGEQIGRKLGFPTANVELDDPCRLVPAPGVYAVTVKVFSENSEFSDYSESSDSYLGVMNIGTRPTFDGHHQTLEVNILDFIGEIYGRRLTIGFVDRLRGEQHFSSPEALVTQMQHDVAEARSIFSERAKQKEQL